MPDATPTAAPEVVVIDGREFAVGDAVLVEWEHSDGTTQWYAGKIVLLEPGTPFPVVVRIPGRIGCCPCVTAEVHNIRENFA